MDPIAKALAVLESHDCNPRKSGSGWEARCPAHDDKRASLSVSEGQAGRVLFHCHAGCKLEEVVSALELDVQTLFPGMDRGAKKARMVKAYPYTDESGALLYEVVRFEPKNFRQRRPDGNGGHIWNMKGVRRVLYRLPSVPVAVKAGMSIWIVEGEKDADNLVELGLVATTSVMGAGKWRPEYGEQLRGARRVIIIPDNDEPGRNHANQVARSLAGIVPEVRILELPGPGKDVSDWCAAGGTRDKLERLAELAPAPAVFACSRFVPVTDFFAQCGQRVDYVLEPFIIKGGFVLVIAAPKAGKTFFVCWLAAAVAAKGKPVLIVEEEGPREILRDRLAPFLAPNADAYKDTLHIAHRKGFRLDNRRWVDALIADANARRAELIVLDPFVQLHGRDENEQAQMAMVVQAIHRIIAQTGAAVALVHHTKKGDSWDKRSAAEAQSADARGSGVLVGAADSVIALKGVPLADRCNGELRFYVENTDTRVGAPFARKLAVVKLDGGVGSIEFVDAATGALATLEQLLPRIPYLPGVITVDNLRQAAGIGKPKVQAAVDAGMGKKLGRVEGKKGGIYRLRNDGPVRDSPSQSATSRTADSDSSRESAISPLFGGPDRDQLSGVVAGTASQCIQPQRDPRQHWPEQTSQMPNGVDAVGQDYWAEEAARRWDDADRAEAERLKRLGQPEEAKKFEESAAEAEKKATAL